MLARLAMLALEGIVISGAVKLSEVGFKKLAEYHEKRKNENDSDTHQNGDRRVFGRLVFMGRRNH